MKLLGKKKKKGCSGFFEQDGENKGNDEREGFGFSPNFAWIPPYLLFSFFFLKCDSIILLFLKLTIIWKLRKTLSFFFYSSDLFFEKSSS